MIFFLPSSESRPTALSHDFDPVGQVAISTMMIASNPSKPWKSINELIRGREEETGRDHLYLRRLESPAVRIPALGRQSGAPIQVRSPRGLPAEAIWAALGGHADQVMRSTIASIASQFKAKKLNLLMVFNEKRQFCRRSPRPLSSGMTWSPPRAKFAGPEGMDKAVLDNSCRFSKKVIAYPEFLKGMGRHRGKHRPGRGR